MACGASQPRAQPAPAPALAAAPDAAPPAPPEIDPCHPYRLALDPILGRIDRAGGAFLDAGMTPEARRTFLGELRREEQALRLLAPAGPGIAAAHDRLAPALAAVAAAVEVADVRPFKAAIDDWQAAGQAVDGVCPPLPR